MSTDQNPDALGHARQLRRNLTFPERLLWSRLRDRRLSGQKFVRQAPIGPFIVDFLCRQHSLVIELDGASHDNRGRRDMARQRQLEASGFRVIRFSNDDVLREMDTVLEAILKAVDGATA
ncbi:hypothetical protein Pan44_34180 [Caulifigura coniformis]|uniref:DUF559 domain-containing protein n=1 Tax=Caulifigura coniformis TaxID=2527983 RepID=A0A517SGX3_9PLAN|nr:DUF559 domain-containing protein [Caulifigura coniformis]QDT55375.1 hypothetical protein Pan44_34180 [Caulifigura coniformis]